MSDRPTDAELARAFIFLASAVVYFLEKNPHHKDALADAAMKTEDDALAYGRSAGRQIDQTAKNALDLARRAAMGDWTP